MKKTGILVIVLLLAFTIKGFSQQKYGHINSGDILEAMPEYKQLGATIEKRKKDAQTEMEKMYHDFEQRKKEMDQYGASMMQAVREEKMKELDSLQTTLTAYEGKVTEDIKKLQAKLMKPLNDKYLKIVSAVAKENGYAYIFDVASGSLVYYPEKTGDITEMVKKRMIN